MTVRLPPLAAVERQRRSDYVQACLALRRRKRRIEGSCDAVIEFDRDRRTDLIDMREVRRFRDCDDLRTGQYPRQRELRRRDADLARDRSELAIREQ